MKKISLVVFPALTIVLEALPLGAVCTFAPSPTERVRETFSYFSLIPFGYANFTPLITAILTVVILLLSLISLKKDSVFNALFVLSIITAIISLMPLMYGLNNYSLVGAFITIALVTEALDVSRQTVSNWENEKTYPDIVSVIKMSDLCICTATST